jgi:CHAT domain-containing protein
VATIERMADSALDRPGAAVAADSVAAYALLAVLQADAGDAAGAFATLERKQAQALRVSLATNERDIARGATAEEREAERAADVALVTLRVQLEREAALPKPDDARVRQLQERIDLATARRHAQRARLFGRLPALRIWRGLAPPAVAADAAAALPDPGTVMLELAIDDDDLLAVTALRTAEGVEFHARLTAISRQAIAERVARALDPDVLRNTDAWRGAAAELVALFPADAWRELAAGRRALVVPDGVLWRVPFEALPAGAHYLGDSTTVVYAGSLTSLVRAPAGPLATATIPLLAVGFPALTAGDRESVAATAPTWTLRPPDAAEGELRAIAARFSDPPDARLSGAAATEAAFRDRAPSASVLHLAAPFRVNGASALFSPLLLSKDETPAADRTAANDGLLQARELMNLDLMAGVAVLSDGAAISTRDAAPAVATVQWAWHAAGVPSLVLARWTADEAASAVLLAELHARLRSGDPPETALQGAQRLLRAAGHTSAPYFWAGWEVVGR